MDQTHEANHSHARMALQRRSHGNGLRAEMLRSRRRGNLQRYEISVVMRMRIDCCPGHGELAVTGPKRARTTGTNLRGRGNLRPHCTLVAKSMARGEPSAREASGCLNAYQFGE